MSIDSTDTIEKEWFDCFGNKLKVGDNVIHGSPYGGRYLRHSKITRISDKLVRFTSGQTNSSSTELVKITQEQVDLFKKK